MFKLTNLLMILSVFVVATIAAPYQELAPKAGHVPVYIREGNTPLSQIHPKLVEAFHEDEEPSKPQVESLKSEVFVIPSDKKEDETVDNKEKIEEVNEEAKKSTDLKAADEVNDTNKEQPAKVEETTASDIAEFNSDDLKILADDE